MKKRNTLFLVHFIVSISQEEKSMFAVLHSDINSLKSGLLHLTGQPYCKQGRSAKVKDGIINLFLRSYLLDRYICGKLLCLYKPVKVTEMNKKH